MFVDYVTLVRPLNGLMAAAAVVIGGLLAGGAAVDVMTFAVAAIAAFVITGAGNAINDCVDREADKINKPNRPIAAGRISKRAGIVFAACLFAAGILLASFLTVLALAIAVINVVLLVGYTTRLQNKLFVGNMVVSYLVGSSFLFGGAAVGDVVLPGALAGLAFLTTFAREIVKDLEDREGDKKGFLKNLARKVASVGERFGWSAGEVTLKYERLLPYAASGSLITAVVVSPVPYLLGLLGPGYLAVLGAADVVFVVAVYRMLTARTQNQYAAASKFIKLGMFLALVAFLVGMVV